MVNDNDAGSVKFNITINKKNTSITSSTISKEKSDVELRKKIKKLETNFRQFQNFAVKPEKKLGRRKKKLQSFSKAPFVVRNDEVPALGGATNRALTQSPIGFEQSHGITNRTQISQDPKRKLSFNKSSIGSFKRDPTKVRIIENAKIQEQLWGKEMSGFLSWQIKEKEKSLIKKLATGVPPHIQKKINNSTGGMSGNDDVDLNPNQTFKGLSNIRGAGHLGRNSSKSNPLPSNIYKLKKEEKLALSIEKRILKRLSPNLGSSAILTNSLLRNPPRFILNTVTKALKVAGPLGLAIGVIVEIVAEKLIRKMFQKGGGWNLDYHRSVEDEMTGFFTLETQKRKDIGLAGWIVSSDIGFRPVDESTVYNNQLIADEVRFHKRTQKEKTDQYR